MSDVEHMEYGGVGAYIHSPENPTGLVFIAPGALVSPNSPLIQSIQSACSEDGRRVVVADLGQTPLIFDDPSNVHGNFTNSFQKVIDGYLSDSDYADEPFELIGHSMGGAAALSVLQDYSVSSVTVLDPMPVGSDVLPDIDCPVNVIISKVRSYRNPGKRMFGELADMNDKHGLFEVETSKDAGLGHVFAGQEDEAAQIIRDLYVAENRFDDPEPFVDLGQPG